MLGKRPIIINSRINNYTSSLGLPASFAPLHSIYSYLLRRYRWVKLTIVIYSEFDIIIFQFPRAGSREGINGVNASYILVKNFIISASYILKRSGVILITIVDSDFYNNMFRFVELAEGLGISKPVKYKFNPKDYPEYEHTMTHQEENGIADYSKFVTYEFRI